MAEVEAEMETGINNWDLIAKLSLEASVPKLSFFPEQKEIAEYESYFTLSDIVNKTNNTLRRILSILKNESPINQITASLISKSKCWTYLFIILGEQSGRYKPWASESSRDVVTCIEEELHRITNTTAKNPSNSHEKIRPLPIVAELFKNEFSNAVSTNKSTYGNILRVFREKLRKDEWKYYPATVFSFQQLLYCVSYPQLSAYIDELLPLILLFIDDYYDEYKLAGLQCLDYAIKNLNKAELLRKNWADVLYSTMIRSIPAKEPKSVNEVGSILLQLLDIVDGRRISLTKSSKYDEALKQIIFTMEFCSDVQLRIIWMPHLIEILKTIEHATLRWIDRICDMLLSFTSCNDPELWMWILKCTEVCIKNTWLKPKSEMFVEIILRIIFNASAFEIELFTDENQNKLRSYSKDCLLLLRHCEDYNLVDGQLREILNISDTKLHPKFVHTLKLMFT